MYSKKVVDRFSNPKNAGEMEKPDAVGEEGNARCGDVMRIYLKVEKGIIVGIFTLILITPIISGTADTGINLDLNEYYTPGGDIVISGAGEPLSSITVKYGL